MKDFAMKLVDAAMQAGADAADVYCVKRSGLSASVYEGEVDEFLRTDSNGAGIRVLKDNKAGFAYTELLEDPEGIAKLALGNAEIADADANLTIAQPGAYPKAPGAGDMPEASDVVNAAMELYDSCMGIQYAYNVQMCAAESEASQVTIANSNGVCQQHERSNIVVAVDVVARRGDWTESGFGFDVTKSLGELQIEATAQDAMRRAMEYYGAGEIASGTYPTVLRREAAKDLLEAFSPIFSAQKAQDGLSMLAGKEGTGIANSLISIVDDPLNADLPFTAPFDGEGTPCVRKNIVENGKLITLLHNLRTAKRAGVQPTGNAGRGYSSTVDIRPTNFYIEQDATPFADMLKAESQCVIVSEVSGLHAGVNAVSGDFSLLAKGMEVQNGEITRPLTQMVVSGNIYELLRQVAMVGNDMYYGYPAGGSFGSPSLFIPRMIIAG